jgi:hypothetical protein
MGGNDIFYWEENYQIVQCAGCESISFGEKSSNSETLDESGYAVEERIYPNPTEQRQPINRDCWFLLPDALNRV